VSLPFGFFGFIWMAGARYYSAVCSMCLAFYFATLTGSIDISASGIPTHKPKSLMDTTTETVEKTRKVRTREAVLLKVTASKLAELIGDAEIGVSRKELRELVLSKASADVLEKAGL
jgi:hypothetical protein